MILFENIHFFSVSHKHLSYRSHQLYKVTKKVFLQHTLSPAKLSTPGQWIVLWKGLSSNSWLQGWYTQKLADVVTRWSSALTSAGFSNEWNFSVVHVPQDILFKAAHLSFSRLQGIMHRVCMCSHVRVLLGGWRGSLTSLCPSTVTSGCQMWLLLRKAAGNISGFVEWKWLKLLNSSDN